MDRHFYALGKVHQSAPNVAFIFASKAERDAFVDDRNKRYLASGDRVLYTEPVPAKWVHEHRCFRRGAHFAKVMSGEPPKWFTPRSHVYDYGGGFYGLGGPSDWPEHIPMPTN